MHTLIKAAIAIGALTLAGGSAYAQDAMKTAPMAGSMAKSAPMAKDQPSMKMSPADMKALEACRKMSASALARDAKCKMMVEAHPMPMAGAMMKDGAPMKSDPMATTPMKK